MTVRSILLSLVLLGCCSTRVGAQAVQLPSFSVFSIDTAVMAPDRGSAYIGGVRRSSSGATAFGPSLGPRRAIGRNSSASQLRVKATVHDFASHDEALLGKSPEGEHTPNGKPSSSEAHQARRLARVDESSAERAPTSSLAEARREYAAELAARDEAVLDQVAKARKAVADGKLGVARIFYKTAARDASDELKRKIEREMSALPTKSDSPKVAAASDHAAKRSRAKPPKAGGPRGF